MSDLRMNPQRSYDQRLDDWLEEGAQSVPDWLVEAALEQAHATPQLGRGFRLPWIGQRRSLQLDLGRMAPALIGALSALVVIGAFVLGLISAPRIGNPQPTPSGQPASPSPGATGAQGSGVQLIDVLPGQTLEFYALVGLTATDDAVWTVAVTDTSPGHLVRVDAASGEARSIMIPDARGLLSPPAADGDTVWTASAAGLHRMDATGLGEPVTIPLDFEPAEISASTEGLWVAREGGTSLVDRQTGQVLRQIELGGQGAGGRIIGAPQFDGLWSCPSPDTVELLGPTDGLVRATVDLPANSTCLGRFVAAPGIEGLGDVVVPIQANAILDGSSAAIEAQFDLSWKDVIGVGDRLWFLEVLRDGSGDLALVELDPATFEAANTYRMTADPHLSNAFQSSSLAVAGGYMWVLGAPPPTGDEQRAQIMRVPLSDLDGS
jgi:hypothetical protein